MSSKAIEVELDNGYVRAPGGETLPLTGRGLLTLLDVNSAGPAETCSELADRWSMIERLSPAEGKAFADDIVEGRAKIPALKSAWD